MFRTIALTGLAALLAATAIPLAPPARAQIGNIFSDPLPRPPSNIPRGNQQYDPRGNQQYDDDEEVVQTQEHADHVDAEHLSERLQRIFRDRGDVALDPRIVVEDVDGAESVHGSAYIFSYLFFARDIRGDADGLGGGR